MRAVDITPRLERRLNVSRITYSTLYVNRTHVGFSDRLGIGFVKRTKAGVRQTQNGRVRWYNTCSGSLLESLRDVRKFYSVQIPSKGWEKVRVRHYSDSDVEQIVRAI